MSVKGLKGFRVQGLKGKAAAFAIILILSGSLFSDDVNTLVQSELAFSRLSSEKGIQAAFLANLAEDSILFRPKVVAGRKWVADHPTPGVLIWEPTIAEISGTKDLGFTTGPYTYKESADAKEVSYGHFFSIWKKQADGSWKVVLDAGMPAEKEPEKTLLKTHTGKAQTAADSKKELQTVAAADLQPDSYFAETISLHDQEYGKDCTFQQDGSGISKGADLAYFYGTFQCGALQGIYVRTWRKTDRWQVALDYRKKL